MPEESLNVGSSGVLSIDVVALHLSNGKERGVKVAPPLPLQQTKVASVETEHDSLASLQKRNWLLVFKMAFISIMVVTGRSRWCMQGQTKGREVCEFV